MPLALACCTIAGLAAQRWASLVPFDQGHDKRHQGTVLAGEFRAGLPGEASRGTHPFLAEPAVFTGVAFGEGPTFGFWKAIGTGLHGEAPI